MALRCGLIACLVLTAAGLTSAAQADDLTAKLRADIDKAAKAYAAITEKSDKALSSGFDKEIEVVKKAKMAAEDRVKLVESLGKEKEAFDDAGALPFSPRMRPRAVAYLAEVQSAVRPLAKSYDKLIDHYTAVGDANAARQAVLEKSKATRKVVGVATHRGGPSYALNADGTIGDGRFTWSLDGRALVMRIGRVVDTCVVAADGRSYSNTNNLGERCIGDLTRPKQ
jgi:hypothetical protein